MQRPEEAAMLPFGQIHPVLTDRFGEAVKYAVELHGRQPRKETDIPYMSHLLSTAALVLEQPGISEDQAIAALLHDAVEDQGSQTSVEEIGRRFGADVARMVDDCTDADTDPKPPWRHRKVRYLAHLETVDMTSLQVSLADKLHNASAMRADAQLVGVKLWERFNAPPAAQHWYYRSLVRVFSRRLPGRLSSFLARTVNELFEDVDVALALGDGVERPDWVGLDSLTGAATNWETARETTWAQLDPVRDGAWQTADERWWVEEAPSGDPSRPVAIFVRPEATRRQTSGSVLLTENETDDQSRRVWASMSGGGLEITGQDLGGMYAEYEWAHRYSPRDTPRIRDLLGGGPDEHVMDVISRLVGEGAMPDESLSTFLENNGVRATFWNRIEPH